MSAFPTVFAVRDSTQNGALIANLTPTFTLCKRISDNADVAQPAITQIGNGLYKFSLDPATLGDVVFVVDAGSALTQAHDRFVVGTSSVTDDSASLSAVVLASWRAATLSPNPTAGTFDEVLSTLRGLTLGRKVKNTSSNTMDVYAPDGTTVLFTITFAPNITAPTSSTATRA